MIAGTAPARGQRLQAVRSACRGGSSFFWRPRGSAHQRPSGGATDGMLGMSER